MQERRKGSAPYGSGSKEQENLKVKPVGLKKPDIHESLKLAGVKDVELEEEGQEAEGQDQEGSSSQESSTDRSRAQRRRRLICCCGDRGCSIGPMTNVEEEGSIGPMTNVEEEAV